MLGPALIGETVMTVHNFVKWKGTVMCIKDEFAYVAVVGCSEMLQVPHHTCLPIR